MDDLGVQAEVHGPLKDVEAHLEQGPAKPDDVDGLEVAPLGGAERRHKDSVSHKDSVNKDAHLQDTRPSHRCERGGGGVSGSLVALSLTCIVA